VVRLMCKLDEQHEMNVPREGTSLDTEGCGCEGSPGSV